MVIDNFAKALTKGIAYTENSGRPDINNPSAGLSGEMKSIFQFMPATWKGYAKEHLNDENAPLTPDTEAFVAYKKIKSWVDSDREQGIPDSEIIKRVASRWNAGPARPDAYKQGWKGKNKQGVSYDTPKYATSVEKYTNKFLNEPSEDGKPSSETSDNIQNMPMMQQHPVTPTPTQDQNVQNMPLIQNQPASNPLTGLLSMIKSASGTPKTPSQPKKNIGLLGQLIQEKNDN